MHQDDPLSDVIEDQNVPDELTGGGETLSCKRARAGTIGARRVHELAELGRRYEQEHNLSPARQRQRQLVEMGRRYEEEHGLAKRKPRKRRGKKGQEVEDLLRMLLRVVKARHLATIANLLRALQPENTDAVVEPPAPVPPG
jgi:hypothetical protein